jgi:hypothetical protein
MLLHKDWMIMTSTINKLSPAFEAAVNFAKLAKAFTLIAAVKLDKRADTPFSDKENLLISATKLTPNWAYTHKTLGKLYMQHNSYDRYYAEKAQNALENAQRIKPNCPKTKKHLNKLTHNTGKHYGC